MKKDARELCLEAKGESEPDLREAVNYDGQYRAARTLLMRVRPAEEVAAMPDREVLDNLQIEYAVVAVESECVTLVKRCDLEQYHKLVKYLAR